MAVRDVNTGSLDRLGPARSTHPFKARQGLKSPSTSHLFSRVSVYYEDTREPFYIFVFSKYNSFFLRILSTILKILFIDFWKWKHNSIQTQIDVQKMESKFSKIKGESINQNQEKRDVEQIYERNQNWVYDLSYSPLIHDIITV